MTVAGIVAILMTVLWVYLLACTSMRNISALFHKGSVKRRNNGGMSMFIEAPFLALLEKGCQCDSVQLVLNDYHIKLFVLNGSTWTIEKSKKEAAVSVGGGYAALAGCAWLAWISGEAVLLPAGLLLGIVFGLRGFAAAGKRLEQRKKAIISALPDMMSKLMLLVGAGETVQAAFARCLHGKEGIEHPLYKEWRAAVVSIRNGQSFSASMERFNRSCAVQEASLFTTVLLLNYRKGGDHFVLAVRELSYSLWEKRKGLARIEGEEASTKLVFPLVAILLIMMVLVAAPAVLLMA